MSGAAVVAQSPPRLVYSVHDWTEGAPYTVGTSRAEVEDLTSADVVSSLLPDDRHAPVLDVDVPSWLGLDPHGGYVAWIDGLTDDSWHQALHVLARCGVGGTGPLTATGVLPDLATRQDRIDLAHAPGWEKVDFAGVASGVRLLGQTWTGSYADLISSMLAAVHSGAPRGVQTTPPTDLRDPFPLPLSVPALLLPSTHHEHLYLETAIEPGVMFDLLAGLAEAGIVERGFRDCSVARGAAFVRLPWVAKTTEPVPEFA